MVTLQELFNIFNVTYDSSDGDYYPNKIVYIPRTVIRTFIASPLKEFTRTGNTFDTIFSVALKCPVPVVVKALRISNHKFKFYEDDKFYYELEGLQPSCLFLSRDECLDYIMELSWLKHLDNVIPGAIHFYIKAAKINYAAYDVILRRVFNIGG